MKLHFVDSDEEVTSALKGAFSSFPEVEVMQGDLLLLAKGCVVSPANGFGFMDGGFDKDLLLFFGSEIQVRVQDAIALRSEGFLPVGASLVIRTGHGRIPYLVIAPTMTLPEQVESTNAYRAMRAALKASRRIDPPLTDLFCPGLTTGVGQVLPEEAAEQMARAYVDFVSSGAA